MSNKIKIKQIDLAGVSQDNTKTRFLAINDTGTVVYWNDSPQAGTSGTGGSGSSGTSGTSGISGSSGTSGISGSSGTSGIDGSSGTSGTSGINGSSGTSGTSGINGSSGTSGTGSAVAIQTSGTSVLSNTQIINFGSGLTVSTSGTSGQVDVAASGGSIQFYDEGGLVGSYTKVNFVGTSVYAAEKPGDASTINIYIPTPTYASNYNSTSGTSSGAVSESGITRRTVRISSPTTEGSPYYTGGGSNALWAATSQASVTHTTSQPTVTFSTANAVTGVGGNSTVKVEMFSGDGTTVLATYTTPSITANAVNTSSSPNAGITVTITNYAADGLKYKASIAAAVNVGTVFTAVSLSGGRYHIKVTHTTDTSTDGGTEYSYIQPDAFYDLNGSTPSFGGASVATISESGTSGNILTKHLSGVEYYILGSRFVGAVDKINNLNQNTQGRASAANTNFSFTAANYGVTAIAEYSWSQGPGTWTGWTNAYDNTDDSYSYASWDVSTSNYRYRGTSGSASAILYDPWSNSATKTSANTSILVDSYSTSGNSTQYIEYFNDEQWRLASNYSTAWDPTATLSNGEACTVGGTIVRPDRFFLTDPSTATIQPNLAAYKPDKNGANPNYTGFSNDASFYRLFYTTLSASVTPIPSFSMVFSGTFVGTALSDLQNQYLKVFVRKIGATSGNYGTGSPPLLLHGAEYDNGTFVDGSTSGTDTPGIRLGSSSGGTINGTFGGFNATNGIYVELRICNSGIKIDTVTVAFN
jgi:hypothetical protein